MSPHVLTSAFESETFNEIVDAPDVVGSFAQGALGFGPITNTADLAPALEKAISAVDAGNVAVVDVRVEPGYTATMTAAMTRSKS